MSGTTWPTAWGTAEGRAVIRSQPEDFDVTEELGFSPCGSGEHVFLFIQKRNLNTPDVVQILADFSDVPARNIGYSGLKDRNAVTRQWFSLGMAGRQELDWTQLNSGNSLKVLESSRHQRKLRRGVHRCNRFRLLLRSLTADSSALERRLETVRREGAPNYFGGQRFGRDGATLQQAIQWASGGGRKLTRTRRGLYLSALRAYLFNTMLAARVSAGTWNQALEGDVCMLQGTRSLFTYSASDPPLQARVDSGDVHPGLPLWGAGQSLASDARAQEHYQMLLEYEALCNFLEHQGLEMTWRPARLMADDFCWQFCDDGALQLDFSLSAGAYATALLAEIVRVDQGDTRGLQG